MAFLKRMSVVVLLSYSATQKLQPATGLAVLLAICFNTDVLGNSRYLNSQWYFHYQCFLKNYLKLQGVKEAHGTMRAQSVTLSSGNNNTLLRRKSIKPLIALHLCSIKLLFCSTVKISKLPTWHIDKRSSFKPIICRQESYLAQANFYVMVLLTFPNRSQVIANDSSQPGRVM